MNIADKVQLLIEPFFQQNGALSDFELVDIDYKKEGDNWFLRIFIDKENGVNLDNCQFASKYIESILDDKDLITTSYFLEVSSPGVERPLKKKPDFDKFKGHLVKVKTYAPFENKKEFVGKLTGLKDEELMLNIDQAEIKIPFPKVASVNLTIE